jgi:hypothetical protein
MSVASVLCFLLNSVEPLLLLLPFLCLLLVGKLILIYHLIWLLALQHFLPLYLYGALPPMLSQQLVLLFLYLHHVPSLLLLNQF